MPSTRDHAQFRRTARALVPTAVLAMSFTTAVIPASAGPLHATSPAAPAPDTAAPAVASPAPGGAADVAAGSTAPAGSVESPVPHAPPGLPRPAGLSTDVAHGGMPDINFAAYSHAAEVLAEDMPRCGIDWSLIAGIGRVESTHADHGATDAQGTLIDPIYGPRLDGSLGGNQVITDTDGGRLDGDAAYDRAVGPTQFIPSTWAQYAADGNGDGVADPQNLYDSALTTGRYLCDGGLDLRNPGDVMTAILRYNQSTVYAGKVLGFAHDYGRM
ncbi:lytic transglycosylase domain-containing protein [Tomitella gaofuii]|uniref:lytic transglycosylase domain-containing protein n=1 Tax=Tomitella gaofuii TaxID=2760083 RepID=UPI001F172645|nr:lytic murein transglycosylase [Tomitella gaofuii]